MLAEYPSDVRLKFRKPEAKIPSESNFWWFLPVATTWMISVGNPDTGPVR